jgi:hypothetical protein
MGLQRDWLGPGGRLVRFRNDWRHGTRWTGGRADIPTYRSAALTHNSVRRRADPILRLHIFLSQVE